MSDQLLSRLSQRELFCPFFFFVKKRAAGKKKVNAHARDWRSEEEEENILVFAGRLRNAAGATRRGFILFFYFLFLFAI
jgi:hypothetical protein